MIKNKIQSDLYYQEEDSQVLSLPKYCEWKNCEAKGEYKAPTSRDKLRTFKWFCLDHVKLYNKNWNYFKGRTTSQINKEVSNDATWHRPTWNRIKENKFQDIHLLFDFTKNVLGLNNLSHLSKDETTHLIKSLKTLNMPMPNNVLELKKQYKKMVKRVHPDITHENSAESIIELNEAYSTLLKIIKF